MVGGLRRAGERANGRLNGRTGGRGTGGRCWVVSLSRLPGMHDASPLFMGAAKAVRLSSAWLRLMVARPVSTEAVFGSFG